MAQERSKGSLNLRKLRAYILLGLVIIAVFVVGWYYYWQYTKYYSTDDAYLDSDRVSVSSKILGRIIGYSHRKAIQFMRDSCWWRSTAVTLWRSAFRQ